ncbi:hypothetical protein GCM10020219_094690 [Nonomuraea dietziae]
MRISIHASGAPRQWSPVTEGDVAGGSPGDIEGVGIVDEGRVTVGGGQRADHERARGDGTGREVGITASGG